jgi:hypothetical protein
MARRRDASFMALRKRFERAAAEGDLAPGAKPADLARFVATIVHGMSVQAASGAGRRELARVAKIALRCLAGVKR